MKSKKPISIRFDENDLLLAINLSGIKKPQKLVDTLISEYVKSLKPKPLELPKDYMVVKEVKILNADGTTQPILATSHPDAMNFLQILEFAKGGASKQAVEAEIAKKGTFTLAQQDLIRRKITN